MDEPVGQGGRHPVGDGAITFPISGRNDSPAFRQCVLTDASVKDELIAGRLYQGRCCVQFVQKEHTLSILGQKIGCGPMRAMIAVDVGQASQVHGIEQNGADIGAIYLKFSCYLLNNL
jgi:hypothetical protein